MLTELDDGVWWYDLGGVNAYLVADDDGVTLVDAGCPWHGSQLIAGLCEVGFGLGDVERILVTHYDLDHVGGLADLDGIDATIYVGAGDAPLVTGDRRPSPTSHKGLFQRLAAPLVRTPSNPVERVADGDDVGSFTVYETPGHTPGHVAYVSEERSVGFLGDLVREADGALEPSPWVLSEDTDAVGASIDSLARRTPDFEVAAMGHGVPFARGGRDRLLDLADAD